MCVAWEVAKRKVDEDLRRITQKVRVMSKLQFFQLTSYSAVTHRKKGKNGRRAPASQSTTAPNEGGPPGRRPGTQSGASAREYRNSHAYVVSQQPLFTSWGLPDYLTHLEHLLPHSIPQPLEIRGANGEISQERGVRIRFPNKRTGVGDMMKRARGLAEWVGREQMAAMDRSRRRMSLEQAFWNQTLTSEVNTVPGALTTTASHSTREESAKDHLCREESTRHMEGLMQDLLEFQERFGTGARKDRRVASG